MGAQPPPLTELHAATVHGLIAGIVRDSEARATEALGLVSCPGDHAPLGELEPAPVKAAFVCPHCGAAL